MNTIWVCAKLCVESWEVWILSSVTHQFGKVSDRSHHLRNNNHIILWLFSNFFRIVWIQQAREVPGKWMFEIRITQFWKHTDGAIFGLVPCESANFTWKLLSSSVFCNGPAISLTQGLEHTQCERNIWTISLPNWKKRSLWSKVIFSKAVSIGQTWRVSQEWQMYIPNAWPTYLPNLTLGRMKALELLC